MNTLNSQAKIKSLLIFSLLICPVQDALAVISQEPLFLTSSVPPLVMLTMDRSHKLYYEAYNDAGDLNGDGIVDVGYKPSIDYYGYFDSHRCYDYDTTAGVFRPGRETENQTTDKRCLNTGAQWSGDFLNYVTTARIDALRKVLYGGHRSVDTTTSTILKRTFIPQDAHAWGKEYSSASAAGYSISDYTPLNEPATGKNHLFANVSLSYTGQPLMRVLNDSQYRIWEWVSIERPVAGTKCLHGGSGPDCAAPSTKWSIVPSTVFSNLVRTTYDLSKSGGPSSGSHPKDHNEFDDWIDDYAKKERCFGYESTSGKDNCNKSSGSMSQLLGNDNNPYGSDDNYMTVVKGKINIPTDADYKFSVDGDDAVEVIIDGKTVAGWYEGHGSCGCNTRNGTINLTAGEHTIEYRHEERGGGDNWVLRWEEKLPSTSAMTDYNVNVATCVNIGGKYEANCKAYTDSANVTTYKPKGLLQDYGENDAMAFGLLTGSYKKNLSGGVLRKNIESFKNEVDLNTGIFSNTNGIVKTINSLRIDTFNYSCAYCYNSGWITTRPINEGEAAEWGNPVAEMMYEGLRYFAGKSGPSPDFAITSTDTPDANMGLPIPNWRDPYKATADGGGGYPSCAKPLQMVISDINPSYDTDQLPGSDFSSFTGDLTGLNVKTLAQKIWDEEGEGSNKFIGQSGSINDGAPTAKKVTSFGTIRGLAPEEPTKLGGYYASSVALFGATNDLNTAGPTTGTPYEKDQKVNTLAVALASPLPRIVIPLDGKTVTLVPFAKSVAGSSISATGNFQPTNQIVDFYVEKIANTIQPNLATGNPGNMDPTVNGGLPFGKFRINYEDVEQAADHDMDAIVEYTFTVNSSKQLIVNLNSTYAAGGIVQHMGYVISGTTADGVYLEVRDQDTGSSGDTDYFLDTPPGQLPGGTWKDNTALPLTTSRTFTLGTTTSASFVNHDPLWYAAKWGVADANDNNKLDLSEWDDQNNTTSTGNPDGVPDRYFLVTNAGKLSEQLGRAFAKLLDDVSSASAVATNTTRLDTGPLVFQAKFDPRDWSGQLLALEVSDKGIVNTTTPNWDAAERLPDAATRKIYTSNPAADPGLRLVEFKWDSPTSPAIPSLTAQQQGYLNQLGGSPDTLGPVRLNWIRGDNSKERRFSGGIFRNRVKLFDAAGTFLTDSTDLTTPSIKTNRLGDIVNSDPVYIGQDDFGYAATSTGLTATEKSSYATFRADPDYKTRPPVVYVGANDGMLHGFDATFGTGGAELFAYIPNALFPELSKLTTPNYKHQYYVDGLTAGGDVFFSSNSTWHTMLAGVSGAGGKVVFGLDVTNPRAIGPSSALWEFTGDDPTYGADLGFTLAEPSIARMHNGTWAVIVGNGYASTNGSAVLFILDAETGAVIQKIDTKAIGGNGLSSPVAADNDGDRIVDAIYAGDLKGNLWKFDVSSTSPTSWVVANNRPLFVACTTTGASCAAADRQPITSKPTIGKIGPTQTTGQMIYFGTGKYFETTDNIVSGTPQLQTFYGLWDDNTSTIDDRAMLQDQTITFEGKPTTTRTDEDGDTITVEGSGLIRISSRETVCYSATTIAASDDDLPTTICNSSNLKKGWAMDLRKPSSPLQGERVVSTPILFRDLVVFATVIPSTDPCKGGGNSRLMLVEALTGKRPSTAPFDIFGSDNTSPATPDSEVNDDDKVKDNDGNSVAASGTDLGIGVHKEISIIENHGYASGSTGDVGHIVLEGGGGGGGGPSGKRTSWRQLR